MSSSPFDVVCSLCRVCVCVAFDTTPRSVSSSGDAGAEEPGDGARESGPEGESVPSKVMKPPRDEAATEDSRRFAAAAFAAATFKSWFSLAISLFCFRRWSRLFLCSRSCASASLSSAFTASSRARSSAERSFFEARPPSFRRTSFETPLTTHMAREPARPATSSLGVTPKGGVEARRALASSTPFFASRGARGGLPPPRAGFCGARLGSAEEERLAFASLVDGAAFSFPEGASPLVFPRPLFAFAGLSRSFLPGAKRRAASTSTAIARGACARSTGGDDGLFWRGVTASNRRFFFFAGEQEIAHLRSPRPRNRNAREIAATALFFSRPDRNERKSFPASPPPRQSRRRGKVPTARRTRARSSTRG